MKTLGIETSCDETAIAIVEGRDILANIVSSHWMHKKYGGVVPEIASRTHNRLIIPILKEALESANLDIRDIDLIAATTHPGLIGALLTGVSFAKSLAFFLNISFVGVHHVEGHIFSLFLSHPEVQPPLLFLVISGGHTELTLMKDYLCYEELGSTLDDACGEAFDKVAKLLNLGYPGGPYIEKLASEAAEGVSFPKAKVKNLDFSYSGLKTAVKYFLEKNKNVPKEKVAKGFQETAFDMLSEKLFLAVEKTGIKKVGVVGGVSVNKRLQSKLKEEGEKKGVKVYFPSPSLSTDNGAMIAYAGQKRYEKFGPTSLDCKVFDRKPLAE